MRKTEKLKAVIVLLFIMIVAVSSSFSSDKKQSKGYGFLYSEKINASKYHYALIDLDVLNSLKISYGCEMNGKVCHIYLTLPDKITVKRSGKNKEIMEFDYDPAKIEVAGEGFKFFYDNN